MINTIIGVIGELGVGKTACLTYLAHKAFLNGRTVYSNYKLYFPHKVLDHPAKLIKVRNALVVGDEIYNWISSLISMSHLQKILSHVYRKSRKMGWDLIYSTQRFKNVHIRLRSITDALFAPRPYPFRSKRITYFKVTVMSTGGELRGKPFMFKLSNVKDLYDTETDIYGFEEIDESLYDYLINVPVQEFHLGKLTKSGGEKQK